MGADTVASGSRVVGSADFVRPTVASEDDDNAGGTSSKELLKVEGVKCAMKFQVKFQGADVEQVKAIVENVLDETERIFSTYKDDSEISKFNREMKRGQEHQMSEGMKKVILMAKEVSNATRGKFDPTIAPLLEHYATAAQGLSQSQGLEESSKESKDRTTQLQQRTVNLWKSLADRGFGDDVNGQHELSRAAEALREFSEFRNALEFSQDKLSMTKKHDNVQVDLNGIAKGYALEEIASRLEKEAGIKNMVVEWAGDIKVKGKHPSGRKWTVAIAEPPTLEEVEGRAKQVASNQKSSAVLKLGTAQDIEESTRYLAVFDMDDGDAVAVSGDYEQVFVHKGKLYSHIANPSTGRLTSLGDENLAQAVVVTSNAMVSDALATAAMSCDSLKAARVMLDPLRTGFREPVRDFLLYSRGGPRIVRMTVPGIEAEHLRKARLSMHKPAHVIIVGGGLAGLSAAIQAADTNAQVTLLEKESKTGGNSAKATSGINGWGTETQAKLGVSDEERLFERDTFRSGRGGHSSASLVRTLSTQSASAVHWLKHRFGIPLDVLSQLGGHSAKRTHRAPPDENGRPVPIGYLIMKTLREAIDSEYKGKINVKTNCCVTKLTYSIDSNSKLKTVTGVEYTGDDGNTSELQADAVVLTTGGFGCDREKDGLMAKYRPELLGSPTTNGAFAVGEGVKMGQAIGAELVDMDKVQLHPTGFIDPKNPSNPTKFLAPEMVRGSGGILVNSDGKRFVNELDLRSVVAKAIQDNCSPYKDGDYTGPAFAWCILSYEGQELLGRPVLDFYKNKLGLWEDCETYQEAANLIGCNAETLKKTLDDYSESIKMGKCPLTQKYVFPSSMSSKETKLVVSRVCPSIHYTMGGLAISASCEVLEKIPNQVIGRHRHIRSLFAAGEVTGGVHGNNRLGGNSLLECVVFGRIAGERAATVLAESKTFFAPSDNEKDTWRPVVMREVRNTDEKYGKNTREVRFNLHGSNQYSGLKVGQFISLRGELDGNTLIGYFSPITRPYDEGVIGILCRVDEKGGPIVSLLDSMRPGSTLYIKPCGGLHLDFMDNGIFYKNRKVEKIGMLAAGTGVAPMIQIARAYCNWVSKQDAEVPKMGLNLVYAAEEESDLSYVKALENLRDAFEEHFRFYLILNRPPLGWTEGVGFVKPTNIKKNIFFPPEDNQLIVICGPPIFEKIMSKTLDRLGFSKDMYYFYSQDN